SSTNRRRLEVLKPWVVFTRCTFSTRKRRVVRRQVPRPGDRGWLCRDGLLTLRRRSRTFAVVDGRLLYWAGPSSGVGYVPGVHLALSALLQGERALRRAFALGISRGGSRRSRVVHDAERLHFRQALEWQRHRLHAFRVESVCAPAALAHVRAPARHARDLRQRWPAR